MYIIYTFLCSVNNMDNESYRKGSVIWNKHLKHFLICTEDTTCYSSVLIHLYICIHIISCSTTCSHENHRPRKMARNKKGSHWSTEGLCSTREAQGNDRNASGDNCRPEFNNAEYIASSARCAGGSIYLCN